MQAHLPTLVANVIVLYPIQVFMTQMAWLILAP